jgi:hypothetical protein
VESRAYKHSIACGLRARFPGIRLDGRADLALLFTLLGVSLLGPLGVLGFVLPRALFDARYGRVLEEALEISGRRGLFLESETRRSFSEASVNTGIFLAGPDCSDGLIPRLRRHPVAGPLDRLPIREIWENRESHPSRTASPPAIPNRRLEIPPVPIVPLNTLGSVRYPVKTGLNRFFYIGADVIDRFGIENDYLAPALKSPRDVSTIRFDVGDAACRLFVCRFSEEELRARGNDGAYTYVLWGSHQHTASGIAWPKVASLRGRTPWYTLSVPLSAHIVCPRFVDRRYLFVVPAGSVVEDQTFYGLILHNPARRDLISAILNSSLVHLSLEQHGRSGLGDGVRQFALCDMASLPVPDLSVIEPACEAAILDAYRHVSRRPLLPVPQEYEVPDRLALDEAVGRAFGLTAAHMQEVRGTVMERMERRLQRARSMGR